MDEILARAKVSKQTVYNAFSDKGSLFSAVVIRAVNEAADPAHADLLEHEDAGDARPTSAASRGSCPDA
jgi:AcrR family transcriptional regulator